MSETRDNLERVQASPLFRWAQYLHWLGVALGLATFTYLVQAPHGITLHLMKR